MTCAIIDYQPGISKLNQTIFFKKTLKSCKTEKKEDSIFIKTYYLPIHNIEKPAENTVKKFCAFLKQEGVFYIYVTERVKKHTWIYQTLGKNFSFFTGQTLINYKTCDIIRKYAGSQHKMLAESTVLIETDQSEKAKDIIEKIYRKVKKIKIKTKQTENFTNLCDYFLKEYGLFIPLNEEKDENDIYIELDSMLSSSDNLNLSADEKRASRVLFKLKNKKEYDQFYTEFLIYSEFGELSKKTVKEFLNRHSVKISKIL